jgi:hypothetical protein
METIAAFILGAELTYLLMRKPRRQWMGYEHTTPIKPGKTPQIPVLRRDVWSAPSWDR